MRKIIVYGPGCARCTQTETVVKQAVAASGIAAEVEKVSDYQAIAQAGIMATPAVAVDGVIKVAGRIPRLDEVQQWITS